MERASRIECGVTFGIQDQYTPRAAYRGHERALMDSGVSDVVIT